MIAPMDMIDKDVETMNDQFETNKKTKTATVRLERRRRIEELHEERCKRDEWGDF